MKKTSRQKRGQIAAEYLVLLGIVTTIVLLGFRTFLNKGVYLSDGVFNSTAAALMGTKASYDGMTGSYKARTYATNYP